MAFIAKGICSMHVAIDRQRAMEQQQLLQVRRTSVSLAHTRTAAR
jgi:hypothetical protein